MDNFEHVLNISIYIVLAIEHMLTFVMEVTKNNFFKHMRVQ